LVDDPLRTQVKIGVSRFSPSVQRGCARTSACWRIHWTSVGMVYHLSVFTCARQALQVGHD